MYLLQVRWNKSDWIGTFFTLKTPPLLNNNASPGHKILDLRHKQRKNLQKKEKILLKTSFVTGSCKKSKEKYPHFEKSCPTFGQLDPHVILILYLSAP